MDQFSAVQVFIRLVETKSITRAAADLEMPRDIARKLLADLEMRLGQKLVNASRGPFRLTAEGAKYYRDVRPLIAGFRLLLAECGNVTYGSAQFMEVD